MGRVPNTRTEKWINLQPVWTHTKPFSYNLVDLAQKSNNTDSAIFKFTFWCTLFLTVKWQGSIKLMDIWFDI